VVFLLDSFSSNGKNRISDEEQLLVLVSNISIYSVLTFYYLRIRKDVEFKFSRTGDHVGYEIDSLTSGEIFLPGTTTTTTATTKTTINKC
jgi:hypothetical protein